MSVTIDESTEVDSGPLANVSATRANVVKLVVNDAQASGVLLNDKPLTEQLSESAFQAASEGFWNAGRNLIFAKSQPMGISDTVKQFRFELRAVNLARPCTSYM